MATAAEEMGQGRPPAGPGPGQDDEGQQAERSLIRALRHFLMLHGISVSEGAVRDLSDRVAEGFDPEAAVSALMHLGFEARFGEMPVDRLAPGHCPAIGFAGSGKAVVIESVDEAGQARVRRCDGTEAEDLPLADLARGLEPFVLLARPTAPTLRATRAEHWFWGSLARGRWLYLQVIVAAGVSNLLGLSTSLFIMVVYDRVVPNEAVESLIALTVGVLIALGFDFVVKTLRAQFIDRAGRRADLRMARLIFERILALKPDAGRRNSGAMASVVREFDTLRDFFTSATLVAVVDLPFVFFFIWVISLIAGPLALVPLIAVPLVVVSGLVIQPFLARIAEGSMESGMSKQAVLVEVLNGLETVQATGSGRLMRRRFEEAAEAQSELGLKNRMLSQFAINAAASIQQLAQVATIFYGVFLIQAGTITMGAMIAAVILGGRTLAPLSQLAAAMGRANGARQAYRSLSAVMSAPDETAAPARRSSAT